MPCHPCHALTSSALSVPCLASVLSRLAALTLLQCLRTVSEVDDTSARCAMSVNGLLSRCISTRYFQGDIREGPRKAEDDRIRNRNVEDRQKIQIRTTLYKVRRLKILLLYLAQGKTIRGSNKEGNTWQGCRLHGAALGLDVIVGLPTLVRVQVQSKWGDREETQNTGSGR